MTIAHRDTGPFDADQRLAPLLVPIVGAVRARRVLTSLEWPAELPVASRGRVPRADLALALAALLFEDVQRRVPMARAYVEDAQRAGRRLVFDHGALRTVAASSGALPAGAEAFARILEPLGYERRASYELADIRMTGHAFAHADGLEVIPQYFVSELHPERFSPLFQVAVQNVIGESRDPLSDRALTSLDELSVRGDLSEAHARELLPELVAAFDRQHEPARVADYETLAAESAEMAWIATEGNAFNHATDRVDDVVAVADEQRRLGRPMKDTVSVSANGRVLQTAFRAARVEALLVGEDGHLVAREVPGSFHELITRRRLEDGSLDLSFDAGNAQSIFKMTAFDHAPKAG